jgi:hypothetical protein
MLQFSLTGGLGNNLGQFSKLLQARSGSVVQVSTQPVAQGDPVVAAGSCSADERYVWKLTDTGQGYWARRSAGESCLAVAPINPDVRAHEPGEEMFVPPDVNLDAGTAKMVEVGPFRFSADAPWSVFSWWGKKLTPEWQEYILKVLKTGGTPMKMTPSFAAFFDVAPETYDGDYVGLGRTGTPKWNPVARAVHPVTGKDYGVFMAISYRYPDKPLNDPEQSAKLDFIWAPISREWYEKIWDWITSVAARIAGFVCDKITDPALATTTGIAVQAGGPIAVGSYGAASLLCSPKTPETPTAPTDDKPAIKPKPKWPYFLAGGIAFVGLLAFLLVPPKKRAA